MNYSEQAAIKKGIYRHNKTGNLYELVGTALQTETNEILAIYKPVKLQEYELFARPIEMFNEKVEINGNLKPRFEKVDD